MLQSSADVSTVNPKILKIANILRFTSWFSLWMQVGLGAVSALTLLFAVSGRNFNQAAAPVPGAGVGAYNPTYNQGTTPGVGISIFWAVCAILALLFCVYLAFRITRYGKRLGNSNSELHPKKVEVMQLLKIAVIAGLIGMLLAIFGGVSSLSVLLSKSIAQPQGVAIYDPTRIIRALDIFVAIANMSGIVANFVATGTSAGLFIWLHPEL